MPTPGIFNSTSRFSTWLIATALIVALPHASSQAMETIELKLGDASYRIELATTFEQRSVGLMHRQRLGPSQGMLLVYPDSGDRRIWMKNVLIPLRVYWIDADFTVLAERRLEPCRASPCETYAIDAPARYVLELGDYEHPLAPGDRIDGLRDL